MKLSKKLAFLGAAALLATAVFVGCTSEDEEDAFSGSKFSITEDPTKGDYYRAFDATKTKHYSANAIITIENCETLNSSYDFVAPCASGFTFGLTKGEQVTTYTDKVADKEKVQLYSCGLATVRYDAKNKNVQWYVSWLNNVPNSIFGYNNSMLFDDTLVTDAEGNTKKYGEEKQIIPTSGSWKTVSGANASYSNGTLKVMIKTVANDDGSYTVSLCSSNGTTEYDSTTIPASTTGFTAKTQNLIGRYLVVYTGQTAKGSVEYKDVSGMAIPADYE